MTKLMTCLGLVMALALTGCTLYFGPNDHGDGNGSGTYSYCDDTGCYTCDSYTNECWPQGGGVGCSTDNDCAGGCYCDAQTNSCVETGFCTYDSDCPSGEVCDGRETCIPGDRPDYCWNTGCALGSYCDQNSGACVPSTTCNTSDECDSGSSCVSGTCTPTCAGGCYYDPTTGACIESGFCTIDNDCPAGDVCDTTRSTCIPNPNPPPPACNTLADETSCTSRPDCDAIYGGVNCHDPANPGNSCTSPGANCVCDSYYFAACTDAATPAP
jgi:hypothetical protein